MANRSTDVPDNSMLDVSGVEPSIERGQTSSANAPTDPTIAQLTKKLERLERQLQSQDDRLKARLNKERNRKTEALKVAAEMEGWDEDKLKSKLEELDQKPLTYREMLSTETDNLETGDTPPPSPTARATNAAPNNAVVDEAAHAQQLTAILSDMGLTDADLKAVGGNGLVDFVGKPHTRELVAEWTKRTARALEQKEQLAAEVAARKRREGEADEVAEEIEQFGNLGGTVGERGAGGSPSPNQVARLKEQAMKEYRGTGRIADALAARRAIEQRYGG